MASHFLLMLLFAGFVSLIFALVMRDETREQARFGVILFGGFAVAGVFLAWLI